MMDIAEFWVFSAIYFAEEADIEVSERVIWYKGMKTNCLEEYGKAIREIPFELFDLMPTSEDWNDRDSCARYFIVMAYMPPDRKGV